jgi:hypothetical protein
LKGAKPITFRNAPQPATSDFPNNTCHASNKISDFRS